MMGPFFSELGMFSLTHKYMNDVNDKTIVLCIQVFSTLTFGGTGSG